MKKAIVVSLFVFGMMAAKAHASTPYAIVESTEVISIVSVSTVAATRMDSDAPADRSIITIQNQSADDFVCQISSIAMATVSTGFIVGMSTTATTNVPNTWTRHVKKIGTQGAFRTYCQSKGTGAFGTAAVYQGGSN